MAGETNVQGEKVKKLDVIANQLMVNMLQSSYTTCLMVSEENENEIEVDLERQVNCLSAVFIAVSTGVQQKNIVVYSLIIQT